MRGTNPLLVNCPFISYHLFSVWFQRWGRPVGDHNSFPTILSNTCCGISPAITCFAIPFRSMKQVVGTDLTRYFLEAIMAGSSRTGNEIFRPLANAATSSFEPPMLIPSTARSFSEYFFLYPSRRGIPETHSLHPVAQKRRTITFPLKSDSF